jgi:cell division protein FtsB
MDDNTERIQDAIVVQGSKIDNVQTQVQKQGVAISSLDTRYRSLEARQNQLEAFVQRLQGLSRAGSVASAASTRPVFTRPANTIHYT